MKNSKNKCQVSVCISTYNHEDFIVEALNSVLMQECNFEYEIILSNDKSPDKSDEVISKFMANHPLKDRIKYFNQQTNLGINGNLIFTLELAEGKYIALLEGDDYWIDKTKLQQQYDFLEKHPDFSVCTGAYETNAQDGSTNIVTVEKNERTTYTFNDFLGFRPHYLNMFFKKSALNIYKLKTFTYSGDNVIFIMALKNGKGYFFNQVFGYRRYHIGGAWSSKTLIDKLLMSSVQFIGLYIDNEYRRAVRPILFYYYADLIDSSEKKTRYLYNAFKMIRTSNELLYFTKKIFYQLNKAIP